MLLWRTAAAPGVLNSKLLKGWRLAVISESIPDEDGDQLRPPLNIVLVSGTSTGGAAKSTHELAKTLHSLGHEVRVLSQTREPKWVHRVYKRSVNLSTKLRRRGATQILAKGVEFASSLLGARTVGGTSLSSYSTKTAPLVENALPALIADKKPDVVVACSIERVGWLKVKQILGRVGIPSVLYFREENAIGHLTVSKAPGDLLISNAQSHANAAAELGYRCELVPSVVDLKDVSVDSTRESMLFVNVAEHYGVDLAVETARLLAPIPVVLQESWVLPDQEWETLNQSIKDDSNIELRRRVDNPAEIYRDAKILGVAVKSDTRPRTILEASFNGIPVVTYDRPALCEAAGPAGTFVPDGASAADWADAIRTLWNNPVTYKEKSAGASAYARRDEISPNAIANSFVDLMHELLTTQPINHDEVSNP